MGPKSPPVQTFDLLAFKETNSTRKTQTNRALSVENFEALTQNLERKLGMIFPCLDTSETRLHRIFFNVYFWSYKSLL